jgi:oligopeptide transport system substrate-binding protein
MKTKLLLLAALLALAGCGKRETAVEAGLRTQTLLVGNGAEPASLDPHSEMTLISQRVVVSLFEGLTVLDETTSQPLPGVAERWEVSPNGLVYTFHLRPNARWSNGDPVTARDFTYYFERILQPALGAQYAYMLWPIKNAEAFNTGKMMDFPRVGVEAVDDRTLRITLEHPVTYLPALAAHTTWMPVHRATVEKFGRRDDRTSLWARAGKLVGNGAFTLAEWRPNSRIVVSKNPRYWDAARTRLTQIVFFPTESAEVEEHNFRAGQVHLTDVLPLTKIEGYRAREPDRLRVDPILSSWFLRFNIAKPPLSDLRVRRALSLAIDRTLLSRSVLQGAYPPARALTPPGCGSYLPRANVPDDPVAARRLLAEAGFPGGRGLPKLEMLVGIGNFNRTFEAIQEMWRRELGVFVSIALRDATTFYGEGRAGNFAIALDGFTADYPDPMTFLDLFVTNGGNNWTGWADRNYDRLIAEAGQMADPIRRAEILQTAEALLLEQGPIAPLYFRAKCYLIHPAVKGWAPSPLGLHRYQNVWLEP